MKTSGLFGADYKQRPKDILSGRFLIPPFSVLSTREGWWQERKQQWIAIGIKSEVGRGYTEDGIAYNSGKSGQLNQRYRDASPGGSPRPAMNNKQRNKKRPGPIVRGDGHGRTLLAGDASDEPIGGTSVFDPVLCELVYRWFCFPGGHVLDPFAGGSVRGIIAGELGLHYTGIDLSERQLVANRQQAKDIGTMPVPEWIHGDSADVGAHVNGNGKGQKYNLLFSCPPYGDLEVYSQDPRDLSALPLAGFRDKYAHIIELCSSMLAPNSFACFVVGDYRDKDGFYCNLPGETIAAFERAGLRLYNSAILVNVIGSLPLRVDAQFSGSRKLGTCHQYVLVFAKGQPREFVKKWPRLEF